MESTQNEYHISFFKPANEHARANRNMVIWLVLVWAVAIFGFHVVLRLIEKPTPEAAYTQFEQVWPAVIDGTANAEEWQVFAQSNLSVFGKNFTSADEQEVLVNAISFAVSQLSDSSQMALLMPKLLRFEQTKANIEVVSDENYVEEKNELISLLQPIVGLESSDIRAKLLPLSIESKKMQAISDVNEVKLPEIMSKYLIHNQSFLTDFTFLGFPFHYFYTSVFLLILFIALCIIYCKRTENINAQYNIPE